MPSIRFSSVGGMGLVRRGAWRSIEASKAVLARRVLIRGGVESALVGTKPSKAKTSPPPIRTNRVMMTPRMQLRIPPPMSVIRSNHSYRLIYLRRVAQDGKRILDV